MANWDQAVDTRQTTTTLLEPAWATSLVSSTDFQFVPPPVNATGGVLDHVDQRNGDAPVTTFDAGVENLQSTIGFDWFEAFHVLPRFFDLGNVLSDQAIPVYVFLATRRDQATWTSLVNNAGAGIEFVGLPSLPLVMDPQTEVAMTLNVSTAGDPFVDSTFDYVFSLHTTVVPIELQRIVLWSLIPEMPFTEQLAFRTDVFPAKSGKEKRHALRKNPRTRYDYLYLLEDLDRREFVTRLFDFHSRQFGVPVWRDDATVSVAVVATDTVINVEDTASRDFRVGGIAVLLQDDGTFDVLTIDSFTATTITSTAPVLNDHPVGTPVYPLRTCRLPEKLTGALPPVNLTRLQLPFEPSDNDSNLGDISGWNTYNSLPIVDSGQVVRGNIRETRETELITVDSVTGIKEVTTPWDGQLPGRTLTIRASGRAALWDLRQFAHWTRGRQQPFYVPEDRIGVVVTADLLNLSASMEIENIGYAQFVRHRSPLNVIRVEKTDGTYLYRTVSNSVLSGDPTKESLTVDVVWPSTITVAEIARVDFMWKVRYDTDRLKLEFPEDFSRGYLTAPVRAVFE